MERTRSIVILVTFAAAAALSACQKQETPLPQLAVSRFELSMPVVLPWWTSVQTDFLHNQMIAALVQRGDLAVVERSRLDTIIREQALVKNEITDPDAAAELGRMLGAKFFLLGTIAAARLDTNSQPVPYTDRREHTVSALLKIDYRLVDVETSAVIAADTVESRDVSRDLAVPDEAALGRIREKVMRECAGELARRIADVLAPVRVVRATAGEVQLDRGASGGVRQGQAYDVFAAAEGSHRVAQGDPVARIEVVRVSGTTATARIADGGPVRDGAVCRALPEPLPEPAAAPVDPLEGRW